MDSLNVGLNGHDFDDVELPPQDEISVDSDRFAFVDDAEWASLTCTTFAINTVRKIRTVVGLFDLWREARNANEVKVPVKNLEDFNQEELNQ